MPSDRHTMLRPSLCVLRKPTPRVVRDRSYELPVGELITGTRASSARIRKSGNLCRTNAGIGRHRRQPVDGAVLSCRSVSATGVAAFPPTGGDGRDRYPARVEQVVDDRPGQVRLRSDIAGAEPLLRGRMSITDTAWCEVAHAGRLRGPGPEVFPPPQAVPQIRVRPANQGRRLGRIAREQRGIAAKPLGDRGILR